MTSTIFLLDRVLFYLTIRQGYNVGVHFSIVSNDSQKVPASLILLYLKSISFFLFCHPLLLAVI